MINSILLAAPGFARLRHPLRFVGLLSMFPVAVPAQKLALPPEATGYHLTTRWKPGGEGGGNRLTFDSQAHRLYVARGSSVQIIDTENGKLVRAILGLADGHDVALAPDLNRGFATSGGSDDVLVFDLTSLRPAGAPITVGKQPDAIVYEPLTRRVFAFNGGSNSASVIEAAKGTVAATISLGGTPGSAVADAGGNLFVTLKDKREVLAIDAQKNAVAHRWPLAPGAEPVGLALDSIRHRVFVGCRDGRLIVLDTRNGKHVAELSLGQKGVACTVDPSTGELFTSNGDGTLKMVREDSAKPGEFQVTEIVKTPQIAGALAFGPDTKAIYLAGTEDEVSSPSVASENSPPSEKVRGDFVIFKVTR